MSDGPASIFLCLRSKPSEEGPSSGKGVPEGPARGLLGEALEEDTAPGAEAAVPERLPHVVVPHKLLVVVLNGGTPGPRKKPQQGGGERVRRGGAEGFDFEN